MNSNMKRIIASFLLVILAFIVQTCIFPLLPFLAVYPNLMVILVFSFGFIRGSVWGMGYGLIAGLLMDLVRRSARISHADLYLDRLCKRNLHEVLL